MASQSSQALGAYESESNFSTVLSAELDAVAARRRALGLARDERAGRLDPDSEKRAWALRLLGLSFSGGGIRSATFNLGVLQTLAARGLLKHADYLSTVSGGGYIGTWLAALCQRRFAGGKTPFNRQTYEQFERELAWSAGKQSAAGGEELPAIGFLRRFSNYLTPKLGTFSGDTWALLALYLRNLILNQLVLILVLVALTLLAPRLLAELSAAAGAYLLPITVLLTAVAALNLARNLAVADDAAAQDRAAQACGAGEEDGKTRVAGDASAGVIAWILLPLLIVGWTLTDEWPRAVGAIGASFDLARSEYAAAAAIGAAGSFLVWLLIVSGWALAAKGSRKRTPWLWCAILVTSLVSGAVFGVGMYFAGKLVEAVGYGGARVVIVPPLLALGLLTAGLLHVGLVGRALRAQYSEWLSRLGGLMLIGAIGWLLLTGLLLYSPLLLDLLQLSVSLLGGAGVAWLGTTAAGLLAGRSAQPAASSRTRRWLISLAPWVFIVGLIVAVAGSTQPILDDVVAGFEAPAGGAVIAAARQTYESDLALFASRAFGENGSVLAAAAAVVHSYHAWLQATDELAILAGAIAVVVALSAALSWRFGINDFSLHNLYANRLTRCYLGASVPGRFANPFSGFSANDDLTLAVESEPSGDGAILAHTQRVERPDLHRAADRDTAIVPPGAYPGPYPLINTAVNLVAGRNLAWQERKAASFVLTPLFCGFDRYAAEADADGAARDCYRPTTLYSSDPRPLTLGEAMATSGAAASPNMGYHSSPAFAFLLSILNVRLGRWAGNPRSLRTWLGGSRSGAARRSRSWQKTAPALAWNYLFAEMFGLTSSKSSFVYLSDGGHFENLGIYELVRRGCRYIIACDSGADPKYEFEDLGNAIRKCRIDLGVEIEMDTNQIATIAADRFNQASCAVGKIRYGEDRVGTLLYIKSSRCRGITSDIVNYAAQNIDFPHEPTADQFFSESQFESYRRLGRHLSDRVLEAALADRELTESDGSYIDDVFERLRRNWHPPSSAVSANFSRLAAACDRVFEQLRGDPLLDFLSDQFYPEWRSLMTGSADATAAVAAKDWELPADGKRLAAGFYFCNSLIQLMENVYIDLNLESDWQHPDNSGWLNLFKHWSWSSMLRVTWAVSAAMYGERFRTFCRQRLDLSLGDVKLAPVPVQGGAGERFDGTGLNLHERAQLYALLKDVGDGREPRVYELRLEVPTPVRSDPSEDPATPAATLRTFVFGYALLKGDELVMFRVQDHLRRMTLGRRALACLVAAEPKLTIDERDERALARLERFVEPSTATRLSDFRGLLKTIQDDHALALRKAPRRQAGRGT
jgi:predicted acylesterase/phospholipase RssA